MSPTAPHRNLHEPAPAATLNDAKLVSDTISVKREFGPQFGAGPGPGPGPVPGNSSSGQQQQQPNGGGWAAPRRSLIGGHRLERPSFQAQRLSDVGVAFGQQLTANMGLRLPASQERIIEQTRWLYLRYVLVKLRQNALPLRDLNLSKASRARRAAALAATKPAPSSPLVPRSAPAHLPSLVFPPVGAAGGRRASHLGVRRPVVVTCCEPDAEPANAATIHDNGSDTNDDNNDNGPRDAVEGSQTDEAQSDDARKSLLDISNIFRLHQGRGQTQAVARATSLPHRQSQQHSQQQPQQQQQHQPQPQQQQQEQSRQQQPIQQRKFIMDLTINNQILAMIVNIIREMRHLKPEFYGDTIHELIGIDKFNSLQALLATQMTICQEMIRSEISWCRIAALFSLFGAMSLDCVRLGAPEHVGPILDGFIEFVERDLALWISQQGGWESFLYRHRPGLRLGKLFGWLLLPAVVLPALVWALAPSSLRAN